MGWVKQANKIGKYIISYKGFRIYCTKETQFIESVIEREGEKWNKTQIVRGEFVGINKDNIILKNTGVNTVGESIDMYLVKKYYGAV